MDARRQLNLFFRLLDGLGGISQRSARRQVERKRDHRKLSLMVDRERRIRRLHPHECGKRNRGAAGGCRRRIGSGRTRIRDRAGRANVDVVDRIRGLGKVRNHLQHHVVLIQLGKDDRNLPLPEGVVERVVDGLRKDSQPRCRIAVDRQVGPAARH